MARKRELEKLLSKPISSKMSVKELKSYIKTVTNYVNKTVQNKSINKNIQVLKSAKIIGERYGLKKGTKGKGTLMIEVKKGTRFEAKTGVLKYGYSGKGITKEDLLAHARLLKSHLGIDEYTTVGEKLLEENREKWYESFISQGPYSDMTREEYNDLVKVFGAMGSKLVEKYGSKNIVTLFTDMRRDSKGASTNFVDLAREVYNDPNNKGLDTWQLSIKLEEKITELLSNMRVIRN